MPRKKRQSEMGCEHKTWSSWQWSASLILHYTLQVVFATRQWEIFLCRAPLHNSPNVVIGARTACPWAISGPRKAALASGRPARALGGRLMTSNRRITALETHTAWGFG